MHKKEQLKGCSMEIITYSKQINYIDTLELYYSFFNEQDYVDNIKKLKPLKLLGEAGGRTWFEFPLYRLGIMDYSKALRANQHHITIQYKNEHIFYLDSNTLKGLSLPFSQNRADYIYKRIDFAKAIKSNIDYTYGWGYVSANWRQHPFKFNRVGETTIYLGERRKGHTFRIYNKVKELIANRDYKKIGRFKSIFGSLEKQDIYIFEYELRRKYLYDWGIHTLAQHGELIELVNQLRSNIYLIKDTEENRKLIDSNNYDDINERVYIDEYIGQKKSKPRKSEVVGSFDFLYRSILNKILNYANNMSVDNIQSLIAHLFNELSNDVLVSSLSSLPPSPSPRLSVLGAIKLE